MRINKITQVSSFTYGDSKVTELRFEDLASQRNLVLVTDIPEDVLEVMAQYVDMWRASKEVK